MIGKTFYSYRKAHEILWKHGYWRFLLAPLGLSVILFVLLVGGCFFLSSWFSGWVQDAISRLYDFPDWLQYIWLILFFALGLGTCYVAFRSLVMVCYGPFLEQLSVKAEEVVKGESHEVPRSIPAMIKRPLFMVVFSVGMSLFAIAVGFLLGLIPIVGVILSPVLLFPTQIFLSTIAYVDPYLDRSGLSGRTAFQLMRRNFFGIVMLGLAALPISIIPIVGWFLGPTYSAVAGIVFAILITEKRQES